MDKDLIEVERRIEEAFKTKAKVLDLSEFDLENIPPSITKLTLLNELNLTFNRISDISILKELKHLTSLELFENDINDISVLKELKFLTKIDLGVNKINDISVLKELKYLKDIGLAATGICDILILRDLKNLIKIDLSENPITDYSILNSLSQLKSLSLNFNHNVEFLFLENLNQLISLELMDNQIAEIPAIENLQKIRRLDISENQISDISAIKNLTNLVEFNCGHNLISDVTVLKELKQLNKLDIGSNLITDISILKFLNNLTDLGLGGNLICDISELVGLKKLKKLNLFSNLITDISFLKDLKQLSELYLINNPIWYIPKEIYNQFECSKDLFSYWQEIEHSQKVTNNQLKIMFLGNGCMGKTTLLHWFVDNAFKDIGLDTRTHGVIIKPLPLNDGKILGNFWDFGGQEVYHATHRLFLGKRTLYILVWAIETQENEKETRHNPHYWLDMIADIADKNDRSRVLIVQNIFENQKEIHLLSNEEIEEYAERGLDISTMSVNAKSGTRIKQFKLSVEEKAEILINQNVEELPETWVNIRNRVAELREAKEKTLNVFDFEQICEEYRLTTDFKIALDYLHNAGEVFYYANSFNNRIILDQEWALQAVYAVLKNDKIERHKGEFTFEDLKEIWKEKNYDLTEEEAGIFLNFMLSNQIMFRNIENEFEVENRKFVIPQLLPNEFPLAVKSNKNRPDSLIHRIEYAFLHRDIIERFIVRTAQFSVEKAFWKNGVFIEFENSFAIIEVIEEAKEKKINIECFGLNKEKLLQRIREEFNKIRPLTKAKEFRFSSGHWVSINDRLENKDLDKSGFKYEPLGEISNLQGVKDQANVLVGEAKTKEAIELIQKWAKACNNTELQFAVTMIKADWSRIKNNEIIGITESIESRYASINKRILEIDWENDK